MIRKGSFAVCLIAAAAAVFSAVAVQCSEVSTPQATKYTLKPQVYGTSDGTDINWGYYGYQVCRIRPVMWGGTQNNGYVFSYYGYAESGIYDFTIDDYTGSSSAILFMLSRQYTDKLRVYSDGRVSLADGTYSPSEKLYVSGSERVTGNLRVDQGIGLGTAPSSNPSLRGYSTPYPSNVGAVHGDLAWDSDANPYNGWDCDGDGGWVVYDSYNDNWRILYQN